MNTGLKVIAESTRRHVEDFVSHKNRYLITANIVIMACLQSHRSYSEFRIDISSISSRNPVNQ